MKKFLKKQIANTLLQYQQPHSKMQKLPNLTISRQCSENNRKTRQNKCKATKTQSNACA
jgi:hypothetical protein